MATRPSPIIAVATSVLLCLSLTSPVRADVVVSPPQHVRLGFQAAFPVADMRSGDIPCVSYSASFTGTGNLAIDLGADLTFSYDRADVVPGGMVPVDVTYTPTDDPGPEATLDATADVSMSTDLDGACIAAVVAGCLLNPVLCAILIAIAAAIDTFDGELDDFSVISAMGDFTPMLGADPAVAIPGTGGTATLSFVGVDLVQITPVSSLMFGPTPPGAFPGLGGGVALASATGATVPPFTVLEYQAPGTLTATLTLPAMPGPSATLTLNPVLHWLNTTASLVLDVDLLGVLDVFDDPADIPIFSGNLGEFAGADALVCPGFPAIAQPGCMAQVAAGNLPYPGLVPQPPGALPVVPPLPAFAPFSFVIDLDSDDDGLLDGVEIDLGLDPDDPDSDDDGYDDGVEVGAECDPLDGTEIPLQPSIYPGSQGGGSPPNAMMTYAAPATHRVDVGTDITCAPDGLCSASFCSVGRIGDPCVADSDCDQPLTTCRVVVNFSPDVPDLLLLRAEFNKVAIPFPGDNVLSPPGCSRKLDLPIDPGINKNKLILQASGTLAGRIRKDKDSFTYRQ